MAELKEPSWVKCQCIAVNPLYDASRHSRWMIRRAVPNGPRVAATVEPLSVAAAAVDDDDDLI